MACNSSIIMTPVCKDLENKLSYTINRYGKFNMMAQIPIPPSSLITDK